MATILSGLLPLFQFSPRRCTIYDLNYRYIARHRIASKRNKCLYRNGSRRLSWRVSSKVICSGVEIEDSINDEACELVNGVELVIGEEDDQIHAYLMKAVKNNNGTGLLLLSDVFGFEDTCTRDFAYRVSCNGYNVLLPDLFRGNPWKNGHPEHEFKQWLSKQNSERIAKDISTSIKWLTDEFTAAGVSKKFGVIGFSFGGKLLIETLARDQDANFATGVSFYGANMDSSLGDKIKVPLLFIAGDNDPLCPVSTLEELEKTIQGSKVVIYKGRGHRFVDRPASQDDDEDSEHAFTVMRNWLHDALLVNKRL